ncbi:uncharacterized protein LOC120767586, partial [Bactrocera tryoni]|uniref:uncharacterized protein LOC120767586 n=1 Tax=Bactrocera tryoni TaxID=59916 RepID=UPI001A9722AC
RSVSLVAWPAIDVNSLLQQTIRKTAVLHEPPTARPTETQGSDLQHRKGTRHGSNDSSSATLTPSITTIIKYPPMNSAAGSSTASATPQQISLQSLNAVSTVTAICGSNGASVVTTASAPSSGRVKRTSKFSPASTEAFNCDPILFGQERRTTEIIL